MLLGVSWGFLLDLGCEKPDTQKHRKTVGFGRFFKDLGGLEDQAWLVLVLCWAMLALLDANLGL